MTLDGIEVDLESFPDCSVTLREYRTARGNTAGWAALYPKLEDTALVEAVENCLKGCTVKQRDATYEALLVHRLVPELLKRLNLTIKTIS
jgi:hypothetical protein